MPPCVFLTGADRKDPDGGRDHVADLDVQIAAIVVDSLDSFREAVPVPCLHEGPRERRTERPGDIGTDLELAHARPERGVREVFVTVAGHVGPRQTA